MQILYSIFNMIYQFLDSFSYLVLCAIGLAIIFGMMGIVNLAHGEFIMLGAYAVNFLTLAHVPLLLAIPISAVCVGIFGFVIERLIIRHLYGRPMDSVVATWGLSMILGQGMLIMMGPTFQGGASTPLGSFTVGEATYSMYRVLLIVCAIALLAFMLWLFMRTKFGLRARATMQNHQIANSLGTNTNKMYTVTFMLGSAFAGLTGALYAPMASITPNFGSGFIMESFVTVIVGGGNPLVGTLLSSGSLGIVHSSLSTFFGTYFGKLGLLIVAIIFIRILPNGFSGIAEKIAMKRR
ncbi:branched-chain amino acid ABC transporter permease [Paenibacillus solisilvae]|uniref:Branched-chain amino acid ABC transporter permease n=1 Tax=Paenibacillus solisilvae TaxID=2486751 RepID=A0ABW0W4B1_9BACL